MSPAPFETELPFTSFTRELNVLLIDDSPEMVELTAEYLARELGDASISTKTDPAAADEAIRDGHFDCVISDYDMPELDGLELLRRLRTDGIDVPFILFTSKGSESVAAEAISDGVDEYLQKGGPDRYLVLANRIQTIVEKHRAQEQVRRAFLAIESAREGISIIDTDGTYEYLNEAYAALYDRDREELLGEHWDQLYPTDETQRFHEDILPTLEAEGHWRGTATGMTKSGEPVAERLVLTQMDDGGHVCIVQPENDEGFR